MLPHTRGNRCSCGVAILSLVYAVIVHCTTLTCDSVVIALNCTDCLLTKCAFAYKCTGRANMSNLVKVYVSIGVHRCHTTDWYRSKHQSPWVATQFVGATDCSLQWAALTSGHQTVRWTLQISTHLYTDEKCCCWKRVMPKVQQVIQFWALLHYHSRDFFSRRSFTTRWSPHTIKENVCTRSLGQGRCARVAGNNKQQTN